MKNSFRETTPEVLEAYANLKGRGQNATGFFVADSERVVLKLLQAGFDVESILATPEWYARHKDEPTLANAPIHYHAPLAQLEAIIGFNLHQGVMARARRPADCALKDLAGRPLVVLDGITKSENVGAIIRNAAGFGVTGVLLGPDTCHPYNRRAVRASMGNVFPFRIHQAANLPVALHTLKALGTPVYAFENRPFCTDLHEVRFPAHPALVIGSEGVGVSPSVLEIADHFVRIPIDQHVYALNAACASAVALYAFSRQGG